MLEILNDCEVKKKQIPFEALYRGQELSGIYPAQTLKENVVRWINISLLDAKNTTLPEVINDASWILNVSSNDEMPKITFLYVQIWVFLHF